MQRKYATWQVQIEKETCFAESFNKYVYVQLFYWRGYISTLALTFNSTVSPFRHFVISPFRILIKHARHST